MDKLVGRLARETEELGIADRTLILFTGDNGTGRAITSELGGRSIRGGKGQTTDAGTRAPLVGYWPRTIPAGRVCDDIIDFSDFLPTLMEAAGAATPSPIDGRSFFAQLKGEHGKPRKWIYMYYCPWPEQVRVGSVDIPQTPPVRFARDQRWKLYGDGRCFDVQNDPLEESSLSNVEPGSREAAAKQKLAGALEQMPAEGQMLLRFGP